MYMYMYIYVLWMIWQHFYSRITYLLVAHHHNNMQVADPTSANVVSILDTGQKYPQEVQYSTCTLAFAINYNYVVQCTYVMYMCMYSN